MPATRMSPTLPTAIYMGPWMADTIRQCDGLVDIMSYWSFSDVFEEQGVVKTPFYGGYGLVAEDDIPKPAFNAFKLLAPLGDERIQLDSDSALLTRRKDGTLVLAVWNYAPPGTMPVLRKRSLCDSKMRMQNMPIYRGLDAEHGDVHPVTKKWEVHVIQRRSRFRNSGGLPNFLRRKSDRLEHGEFTITLPSHGLAVIELK